MILLENIRQFFAKELAPEPTPRQVARMKVVSKTKRRRTMRPSFARGATIVKIKPLTPDELMILTEKMCREKDPEKTRLIQDEIVAGFYGKKLVPV